MDIPYKIVTRKDEIKQTIADCQICTEAWLKPVAVLVTGEALW
jgi:hypothetical protein